MERPIAVTKYSKMFDIPNIKFSADFPKLWKQTKGLLVKVKLINIDDNTPPAFLEYDTKYAKDKYYPLAYGEYIQLIFLGNFGIPFSTVRTVYDKDGRDKRGYYIKNTGNWFNIITPRKDR